MNRQNKIAILLIVFLTFGIMACPNMHKLTPTQKYAVTRATFNDILEHQYIPFFKTQTPDIQQKLREEAVPVIREAKEALDLYYWALSIPDEDPDARLEFYLTLKNKLINIVAKYGLKITEE